MAQTPGVTYSPAAFASRIAWQATVLAQAESADAALRELRHFLCHTPVPGSAASLRPRLDNLITLFLSSRWPELALEIAHFQHHLDITVTRLHQLLDATDDPPWR